MRTGFSILLVILFVYSCQAQRRVRGRDFTQSAKDTIESLAGALDENDQITYSVTISGQQSPFTTIINEKRQRYPEALAYYDLHAHTGFWRGVTVSDSSIIDSGTVKDRTWFNGLYLVNGQYDFNYYFPSANRADRYTANATLGQKEKYRTISNGVINNYLGYFDIDMAYIDTTYLMNSVSDTIYLKDGTSYSADTLIWDTTNTTDISVFWYGSIAASMIYVDTLQYTFSNNEYYILEFERKNDDTTTASINDLKIRMQNGGSNQIYILSSLTTTDSDWHKTTLLFQYTGSGNFIKFTHNAGTKTSTHIRRLKIGKILNPSQCIFTHAYYVSHVRDCLNNYDDLVIDTTNITDTSTPVVDYPKHIRPFQGLNVAVENYMGYREIDSVWVDSVNSSTATCWLRFDNESDTLHRNGDTVFVSSITPIEYTGYKVLMGADSDSVSFSQRTFDFDITDYLGFIWDKEWAYELDFTFDTELLQKSQGLLVIYGSEYRFESGRYDTPWSYNEYGQESDVLIWFNFLEDPNDFEYFYDNIRISDRIFGIMFLADDLTGPEKYRLCQKIEQDYKSIYQESWAPQLNWTPYEGYWLEKLQRFRKHNRNLSFNHFMRSTLIEEWGDNASDADTLVLFFYSGGNSGWNRGYQQTYEKDRNNKLYMMISDDRGETWGNPSLVYEGVQGVKNSGDTVGVFSRGAFMLPDDSLIVAIGQHDTITSPTQNLGGQKLCFLKTGDLSTFRFIDPFPNDYAYASFCGSNWWRTPDTVYYPVYYSNTHYQFMSADSGQTWTVDTVLTGTSGSVGSEWSVAYSINFNRYAFSAARNDSGTIGIFHTSTDYGNTWTRFYPYSFRNRGGDSAPIALEVLSDDRIVGCMNGVARTNVYFIESRDFGRSWRTTGFMGKEDSKDFTLKGQGGNPIWPTHLPFSATRFSYFNILQTANDHIYDKYSDDTIYITCDEANTSNTGMYFMRLQKK